MFKPTYLIVVLALLFGLGLGNTAVAQEMDNDDRSSEELYAVMLDEMDMTTDKETRFKAVKEKYQSKMEEARLTIDDVGVLQEKLAMLQQQQTDELRNLLEPEQYLTYSKYMEKIRAKIEANGQNMAAFDFTPDGGEMETLANEEGKSPQELYQTMISEMGLSDAEMNEFKSIQQKYRKKAMNARSNNQGDMQAMREKMIELRKQQRSEIEAMLSDEQFATYEAYMKKIMMAARQQQQSGR